MSPRNWRLIPIVKCCTSSSTYGDPMRDSCCPLWWRRFDCPTGDWNEWKISWRWSPRIKSIPLIWLVTFICSMLEQHVWLFTAVSLAVKITSNYTSWFGVASALIFGPMMTKWYQWLGSIKFKSPMKELAVRVRYYSCIHLTPLVPWNDRISR